jgi:hypothetical protein
MPSNWTPCGGEPFGRWRATSADTSGFQLPLYLQSSSGTIYSGGQCPAETTKPFDAYDLRLEVQDGGAAAYALRFDAPSFHVLDSCVMSMVGGSCDRLQTMGSCSVGACGICECTLAGSASFSGTWKRSATTLTFTTSDNAVLNLDYCVQGDEMTVRDASGIVSTLARTAVTGTASPCAQRTTDQCKLGGGCYLGACVGGPTCATSKNESDCTTHQGCSWAQDQCTGTPSACQLGDYGVVPGCDFVPGTPKCTGTASSCTTVTREQCTSVTGCQAVAACVGTATEGCSQFSHACPCDAYPGCSCDSSGICVGTTTCAQQSLFFCTEVRGCSWVECTGTATPCAQLNELTCENTPGCTLQVTAP